MNENLIVVKYLIKAGSAALEELGKGIVEESEKLEDGPEKDVCLSLNNFLKAITVYVNTITDEELNEILEKEKAAELEAAEKAAERSGSKFSEKQYKKSKKNIMKLMFKLFNEFSKLN